MTVHELLLRIEKRRTSLDAWLSDHCESAVHEQQHLRNGSDARAHWHIGYRAALDDILSSLHELSEAEADEKDGGVAEDRDTVTRPEQSCRHRVQFRVHAVHPAGRPQDERSGWERIAQRVNALEIERVVPARMTDTADGRDMQEDQSTGRSVYSFDDITWELAEWMLHVLAGEGMSEFLTSNAREMRLAFHQPDYQTDEVDHFSMFLSVYLGCGGARSVWTETPIAAKAFEDWLAAADATLLVKLETLRQIGRAWNSIAELSSESPPEGHSIH